MCDLKLSQISRRRPNKEVPRTSLIDKLILISSRVKLNRIQNFGITINNCIIDACTELKCLGLIIDSTLSWESQISKCLSACYLRIYSLFKVRNEIPKDQLKIVAEAV